MADAIDGIRQNFQRHGKDAFLAGRPRTSHGMMRGTAALQDWYIGYDMANMRADLVWGIEHAAGIHNSTPADGKRVELAQES